MQLERWILVSSIKSSQLKDRTLLSIYFSDGSMCRKVSVQLQRRGEGARSEISQVVRIIVAADTWVSFNQSWSGMSFRSTSRLCRVKKHPLRSYMNEHLNDVRSNGELLGKEVKVEHL